MTWIGRRVLAFERDGKREENATRYRRERWHLCMSSLVNVQSQNWICFLCRRRRLAWRYDTIRHEMLF